MGVIEINNLVKKYGNNIAVNGLNLDIEIGKVHGFLGPNGAGKSTTMNIITGYIGATSGNVKINGYDILKEADDAKRSFGYLPEIPPLYPEMTVREYLSFVAELKKIKKKDRSDAIEEAMELSGTKNVQDKLIKNLSKGYKQRVGIAQAVMGMPEIIILDEPTVGLDPKQIIEIRQLIKRLGTNHTVILSSHILTEISEVCENIFIMSKGKLVASGTEEELINELAGDTKLILEVKAEQEKVIELLDTVEEIKNYQILKSDRDDLVRVEISTDIDCDIREDLFYMLADVRMPLMSMSFERKTLEDIFIQLTSDSVLEENKGDDIEENIEETEEYTLQDLTEEAGSEAHLEENTESDLSSEKNDENANIDTTLFEESIEEDSDVVMSDEQNVVTETNNQEDTDNDSNL